MFVLIQMFVFKKRSCDLIFKLHIAAKANWKYNLFINSYYDMIYQTKILYIFFIWKFYQTVQRSRGRAIPVDVHRGLRTISRLIKRFKHMDSRTRGFYLQVTTWFLWSGLSLIFDDEWRVSWLCVNNISYY